MREKQVLPADDLVGVDIGNYHLEARLEEGEYGPIYQAIQKNMGRKVRLYTLDRKSAQREFRNRAFHGERERKSKRSTPLCRRCL